MIQRVQTLFLLAVTILSFIMLISPLSKIVLLRGEIIKFYSIGLRDLNQGNEFIRYTIPLFVLILIITGISLVAMLYFKNRTLQLRLCVYHILLSIVLIGFLAFYYFSIKNQLNWDSNSFSIVVIFPLINIVLTFQAFRAIGRDEHLIKSYDRLR